MDLLIAAEREAEEAYYFHVDELKREWGKNGRYPTCELCLRGSCEYEYYRTIVEGKYGYTTDRIFRIYDQRIREIRNEQARRGKTTAVGKMLITINPPDGTFDDPVVFQSTMQSIVDKTSWLRPCQYVVEQRSETDDWRGYHIHCLAPHRKKSYVIRDMSRMFKLPTNSIDVRPVKRDNGVAGYLVGKKTDNKIGKVDQDKEMRKYYDLEDLYVC